MVLRLLKLVGSEDGMIEKYGMVLKLRDWLFGRDGGEV